MTRPGKTGALVRELTQKQENTLQEQEPALLEPGSRARARERLENAKGVDLGNAYLYNACEIGMGRGECGV